MGYDAMTRQDTQSACSTSSLARLHSSRIKTWLMNASVVLGKQALA